MPSVWSGVDTDLEKHIDELIDMVDLSVAFTPVLAFPGEQLGDEVEVLKTMYGDGYIVRHPLITCSVSPERLKVMRLRYLLLFKQQQAIQFAPLLAKLKGQPKP